MTTRIKSPITVNAATTLKGLGASKSSTGKLTNAASCRPVRVLYDVATPRVGSNESSALGLSYGSAQLGDNSKIGAGPSMTPSALVFALTPSQGRPLSMLIPEEVQMVCAPTKSVSELIESLVLHPEDDLIASAVCGALRDGSDVDELVFALEQSSVGGHFLADDTMADLCVRLAQKAPTELARALCRAALDLHSVHGPALSMFEALVDDSCADELLARYQVFLEDAPAHDVALELCEAVGRKLVQAECALTEAEAASDETYPVCEPVQSDIVLREPEAEAPVERRCSAALCMQA